MSLFLSWDSVPQVEPWSKSLNSSGKWYHQVDPTRQQSILSNNRFSNSDLLINWNIDKLYTQNYNLYWRN